MRQTYLIRGEGDPRQVIVTGKRTNMFLDEMIIAGDRGITSIAYPGVRVADAIFKLRGMGFEIETQYEPHDGPFQGVHGRYKLKSRAERVTDSSPICRSSEQAGESVDHVG